MVAKIKKNGDVITGLVRLSYPHLFEKDEASDKYSRGRARKRGRQE